MAQTVLKRRIHVIYSGTVQGVGFRWTTARIANLLQVQGWVKNLPDKTVELVAEGEEENLNAFMDRISASMQRYIRDAKITWLDPSGEFSGFNIRFF